MAEKEKLVCNPSVFTTRVYPAKDKSERACFVIMPFANKETPDKQLQDVYKKIIRPAVEECGLKCIRGDDTSLPTGEPIVQQLWEEICKADIVIAEFTRPNQNVAYETGIVHTIGKRLIGITQNAETLPFDYRGVRCIEYEDTDEGRAKLKEKLKHDINAYIVKMDEHYPQKLDVFDLERQITGLKQELVATRAKLPANPLPSDSPPEIGASYAFGLYQWRVLDVDIANNRALLLSENIIEKRAYNKKPQDTTWEDCTLHKCLIDTFYKSFFGEDKGRIALTHNDNPDNAWGQTLGRSFNTPGGDPTDDRIFLLSLAEIFKYFPGIKLDKNEDGDVRWSEKNKQLVAKYNGIESWWWLRSPGHAPSTAAYVDSDGTVYLIGSTVNNDRGGVRPALWLNL